MSPFSFTTFWGDHWDTIEPSFAKLMGVRECKQHGNQAQDMLDKHLLSFGDPRLDPQCFKPNARILMQELKAADLEHWFVLPERVYGTPPQKFN